MGSQVRPYDGPALRAEGDVQLHGKFGPAGEHGSSVAGDSAADRKVKTSQPGMARKRPVEDLLGGAVEGW